MGVKQGRSILLGGYCPDPMCYELLLFENIKGKIVYCFYCGQSFSKHYILDDHRLNTREIRNITSKMQIVPHRSDNEWVRVNGYSAFYCKVISFLLTTYGIDENNNVKLLSEMGRGEYFDCKQLSDYAFLIDRMRIFTNGYGMDRLVGVEYLKDTLMQIRTFNNDKSWLLPLHVAGDGSCLVHAVSRALVGREIYWHALRENLKRNLKDNEEWYKKTLGEFIADDDWQEIVNECDHDYKPRDDHLGLRTTHIFAMANVLYRPIILVDTPEKMKVGADFSSTFLPSLRSVDECRDKSGHLNKPIVIGWANDMHTHFVPLVTVEDQPPTKFPRSFVPHAWCVSDDQIEKYVEFREDCCEVACGRIFTSIEMKNLLDLMGKEFLKQTGVSPQLISDYCEDVLKKTFSSSKFERYLLQCVLSGKEKRLLRCLYCWRLFLKPNFKPEILRPKGIIYGTIRRQNVKLRNGVRYNFEPFGLFKYDESNDCFTLFMLRICLKCFVNRYQTRKQLLNGRILYVDNDHSRTPAPTAFCSRKMKHVWKGMEYDNLPLLLEIDIVVNNVAEKKKISWFAFESDPSRNTTFQDVVEEVLEYDETGNQPTEESLQSVKQQVEQALSQFPCDAKLLCDDPVWSEDFHVENYPADDMAQVCGKFFVESKREFDAESNSASSHSSDEDTEGSPESDSETLISSKDQSTKTSNYSSPGTP